MTVDQAQIFWKVDILESQIYQIVYGFMSSKRQIWRLTTNTQICGNLPEPSHQTDAPEIVFTSTGTTIL
eukprot:scaffold10745_cov210-Amphora_coffeaeformis.AAC.1